MKLIKMDAGQKRNIYKIVILVVALIILSVGLQYWKNRVDWKTVTFQGCGSSLPDYKYSLQLPPNWIISQSKPNKYTVYYDAEKDGKKFTVGCTTQGVGDDICDDRYRMKFTVDSTLGKACYEQIKGKWEMGTLNLPRNPSNHAAIAFWAHDIEPSMLNSILSSFRIQL